MTCWEYPSVVFVQVARPAPYANAYGPPGQMPGAPGQMPGAPGQAAPVDPWMQPPAGYQPKP